MLVSNRHNQLGLGLVELMIVVAIIGILAATAIPSYTEWMQNTQIRTAAESILNGVQKARAEALAHNSAVRFSFGANSAWTVGCVTPVPDNNADGIADCPADIQSRAAGDGSSNMVTVASVGGTTVTYNNLGIRTAGFTQVNVSYNGVATARSLQINVLPGGAARLCDPNASDLRSC